MNKNGKENLAGSAVTIKESEEILLNKFGLNNKAIKNTYKKK